MSTFVERLTLVIELMKEERGWNNTIFCEKVGVTSGALRRWLNDSDPGMSKILRIASLCDVQLEWLAAGRGEMRGDDDVVKIPMLPLQVSAGAGAFDDINGDSEVALFSRQWLRDRVGSVKDLFQVQVVGESMEPTLRQGDRPLMRCTSDFTGDGIYVLRVGELMQVKRVVQLGHSVEIRSDNNDYPNVEVTAPVFDREYGIVGKLVLGWRSY